MRFNPRLCAAALSATMCSASFGQITGKVMLQGTPPNMPQITAIASVPQCAALHKDPVYEDSVLTGDNGELQNVIVFLKAADGQKLTGPQKVTPAELDQKGCMYAPHVLAVEINQPVIVKNSDGFLHNVHSMSIDNPQFNFAQFNGAKPIQPFTTVETFQLKCDVHPWMKAIVRVFDNPYFAVTGEDGKFAIDTKGLPDGTYTVQAWHEVYHDSAPQQVEVKGGKASKPVEFTYHAKAAKAEANTMKTVYLASADGTAACCDAPKSAAAKVAAAK